MQHVVNLEDFEALARERLDAGAYDYIAGGSWDEATLDRFIASPDEVIPNNKMTPYTGLTDADVRTQIVQFLESRDKSK